MYRTILTKLEYWKNNPNRKPLILTGARQTGKTYILNEFGNKYFQETHCINFQKSLKAHTIFNEDLDPERIINDLELHIKTNIDINNDLILFDEIQDCPSALTSLKYFSEEMPHLALCAAGSLLGVTLSDKPFPVGKVNFLEIYPMSFEEFLLALNEKKLHELISNLKYHDKIPHIAHEQLLGLLKTYYITGGLPEVISTYLQYKKNKFMAFEKVREKQFELIKSYMSDFSKYAEKMYASDIVKVFENIPSQLAKDSRKFNYSAIASGGRFKQFRKPIDWLEGAGVALKVKIANSGELPLSAFCKENRFKLYMFDVGILGALAGLHPKSIAEENNLFRTFKGSFCENFVATEFKYSGCKALYSWEHNTSEVEFIRDNDGKIYPIEVKSGESGKLKSLNVFAEKYKSSFRTRISARNYLIDDKNKIHNYPLYLSYRFPITP